MKLKHLHQYSYKQAIQKALYSVFQIKRIEKLESRPRYIFL